jgi:uncharacterized protein (DUF4415 family)
MRGWLSHGRESTKSTRKRGRPPLPVPSVPVSLRLPADLAEALQREACDVPLATWITHVLRQHLQAQDQEGTDRNAEGEK